VTSLALADTDPATLAVDAVVVGVYQSADNGDDLELAPGAQSLQTAFNGQLAAHFSLLGATGTPGEVTKLASLGTITAPLVVGVGLGRADAVTSETLRRAVGAAVRALAGVRHVGVAIDVTDGPEGALAAMAEGAALGGYRFVGYKSEPNGKEPVKKLTLVVTNAKDKAAKAVLSRASVLADAVSQTRDWVNTAPNELRPPQFAEQVAEAARKAKLDVEVLDEKALRKGGYGGILAVGGGSSAPPRLVRLAYRPNNAERHVALVGKGITFDSGGLSIKPAQNMWEMKSDMSGAAAVAGVMLAVAALKLKVAVTAYLPMAENMPSGTSYRPGDVVTMYNGKRVEILNTDAEGRIILGDAIARACEDKPDYLLETSTLTGGQVIALGKRVTGVMGTPELCERVRQAGEASGEPMWPMPLPEEIRKNMESDVADLLQISSGMDRSGHMLQGGIFLSHFVTEDLPWAHLDIAGPAYHAGEPYGYIAKGGTGVPVRTLVRLLEDIAANG